MDLLTAISAHFPCDRFSPHGERHARLRACCAGMARPADGHALVAPLRHRLGLLVVARLCVVLCAGDATLTVFQDQLCTGNQTCCYTLPDGADFARSSRLAATEDAACVSKMEISSRFSEAQGGALSVEHSRGGFSLRWCEGWSSSAFRAPRRHDASLEDLCGGVSILAADDADAFVAGACIATRGAWQSVRIQGGFVSLPPATVRGPDVENVVGRHSEGIVVAERRVAEVPTSEAQAADLERVSERRTHEVIATPVPTSACADLRDSWDAGHGPCASYKQDLSGRYKNFDYCGVDVFDGVLAKDVCSECMLCADVEVTTTVVPTKGPPPSAVGVGLLIFALGCFFSIVCVVQALHMTGRWG